MLNYILKLSIVLTVLLQPLNGQENAERNIPRGLVECYTDPFLSVKDNLLPHTIETLIQIIRKIESYPGLNQGISQLPVTLLHRFRQDGIARNLDVSSSSVLIPYSASEFHFGKHQLLLQKLLPGNAKTFVNDTLTPLERCSLHSMLSVTINPRRRGDEGQVCNKLANYRAMRVPRSLKEPEKSLNKNHIADVEFLDKNQPDKLKAEVFGKIKKRPQINDYDNEDYGDQYDEEDAKPQDAGFISNGREKFERSECPTESGVVRTRWGTVSAGQVINGIATGLQNQRVPINLLMAPKGRSAQQNSAMIDNRWAATLAGDLSEVALLQATKNINNINIGGSGAWNSSALPKWYFLSIRDKYEMTDAEIRGGIDGLIMALKIKEWQGKVSGLKLSQVLDMYYSQKGVLDTGIRACDRKKYFNEMIKQEELKAQTIAFSKVLQKSITTVTIKEDGYSKLAEMATSAFYNYVSQSLNDVSCEQTETDPSVIQTNIETDLIVFIDTSWNYPEIKDIIGYVLTQINLGNKLSSVTLLDAKEAKQFTYLSTNLGDALSSFNEENYKKRSPGLSLPNVMIKLQNITSQYMNMEKINSTVGGRSLVSLIVPYTGIVNDGESNFAWERILRIREEAPDLRILFFAQGSVNRFERFVVDKEKDLIPAQSSNDFAAAAQPIIVRIKELSRRIINHRCGSTWDNADTGVSALKQCVGIGEVNYYRIMPNYFYTEHGSRKLRIQSNGLSTVTICTSRSKENPRANTTLNKPDDLECKNVISQAYELDMKNPCGGSYEIHNCNPYYLSIEVQNDDSGTGMITSDEDCLKPNSVALQITAEHFTCHSGVERILISSILLIFSYIFISLNRD